MTGNETQPADAMRKRPTQKRAEKTLRTIFEAVAQILARDGEEALTTNRIAERSGYSVGTIYQYFPDKKAIVLTMIRRERRRIMDELHALLAEAENSREHPSHYVRLYIRSLIQAFAIGKFPRRTLHKMAWRMDSEPEVMAAMREMTDRMGEAILARRHPDLRTPDPCMLFVVTRGVMGVLRSAVLEDFPDVASRTFEDELVRIAWSLLDSSPAGPGVHCMATPQQN